MKKKIFITLAFITSVGATANLYAQENARAGQEIKTKGNIKDNKIAVFKITGTAGGCTISVGNEILSPKDAASGLPTGKRMHKPFVITKELDVSSLNNEVTIKTPQSSSPGSATSNRVAGQPIGGITVKGGRNPGGSQFNKIVVEDGQFALPSDCPDGEYTMTLSWSWGASQSGSSKRFEKSFLLMMENGACKGIQENGIK